MVEPLRPTTGGFLRPFGTAWFIMEFLKGTGPEDSKRIDPDIGEIKEKAYDEGYNQAVEDWQIWYYCAVCRKRMDMSPNSDSHKAMIGYMKEHGWGHASCHRQ